MLLVSEKVAERFDLGRVVCEPVRDARGAMGQIWRLETTSGRWAVKECFVAMPEEDLEREYDLTRRCIEAGVRAPMPVRTSDGAVAADIGGMRIRVTEWVDLAASQEWTDARVEQAGGFLATMHAVAPATDSAPDAWYTRREVNGPWTAQLKASAGREWEPMLREQIDNLEVLDGFVAAAPVPPCVICHCDYEESNVMLDRDGNVVVLDWENAGPLAPEWEVALSWSPRFRRAYRSSGGTFAPSGIEVFSSHVAAKGNFLGVCIRNALAGDAWSAERVMQNLRSPLTLAELEKRFAALE